MVTSSLDEQHWEDRVKFISRWINCPPEDRPVLWDANRDLIDADLLEAAIDLPQQLTEAGRPEEARQVEQLTDEIAERLGLRVVASEQAQDLVTRDGFLADAINVIFENSANAARVNAVLEANLGCLDKTMQNFLRVWARRKLAAQEGTARIAFALSLCKLGDYVEAFPRGVGADHLELALHAYLAALEVLSAEAAPQFRAYALGRLARLYNERPHGDRSGNLEAALRVGRQALDLCSAETNPLSWSLAQDQLSITFLERIEGERAENLESSLAACSAFLKAGGSVDDQVVAQGRLATIYSYRVRGRRAENLEAALAACHTALALCPREANPSRWSTLQSNLSELYAARIDGVRAENLESALKASLRALEGHNRESAPSVWAKAQLHLGNAYNRRIHGDRAENLEGAIAAYEAALQIYRQDTDPLPWALLQNNLSTAYVFRIEGDRPTNMEDAFRASCKALEVYTRATYPSDWALAQSNLGMIYRDLVSGEPAGNLENAIVACQAALEIYTFHEEPTLWATSQVNLGNAYQSRVQGEPEDNLELAIGCYRAVLEACSREDDPMLWASAQQNLGSARAKQMRGDHAENIATSLAASRAALTVFRPDTHSWHCLQAASNLGLCAYEAERWIDAWEGYRDAIDAAENMRAWAANARRQRAILLGAMHVYANMVVTCVQLGRHAEALEYAERSKTRGLVELLAAQDLYPGGDVPAEITDKPDHLRTAAAAADTPPPVGRDRPSSGNSRERRSATLPSAAFALPTEDSAFNRILQAEFTQIIIRDVQPIDPSFSLTQGCEAIGFDAIRALVSDDNAAILQWHTTEDRFFAFVITRQDGAPRVWSSSATDCDAFYNWTNEYLYSYHSDDRARWQQNLDGRLARLAAILHLDEVLALLPPGCRQLTIVPHRFLHLFPLHALPSDGGQGPLLLERFPDGVRYTPSCQLLQLAARRPRTEFNSLLVVGDPNNDLTYANVEVDSVRRGFASACVLFGEDATKGALTGAASPAPGQAHCIHLSCHGQFEPSAPLDSFLLLAGCLVSPPPAPPEPGRYRMLREDAAIDLGATLTLRDLFTRQFDLGQCQLATLSACETGLCEFSNLDDEYIGLPSGFLFAGASTVVSSLWAVDDLSTTLLLTRFYENLHRRRKHDPTKRPQAAAALNEAQLWMRTLSKADILDWSKDRLDDAQKFHLHLLLNGIGADAPFSAPYYWAAFCVTGL